ncbi:MAG: hypothetical protein R3Y43_07235 [Alphaproteobacteria bacterium]
MSRLKFVVLISLILSGCSITKPYVDRKRSAGQPVGSLYVGISKPEAPAICYNALTTTVDEVFKMAKEECVKQKAGVNAVFSHQTSWTCSLLNPNHLYFTCI